MFFRSWVNKLQINQKLSRGLLNAHLISLNEVEVFAVNTIAVLKVPTLLLTPGTQLFYRQEETKKHIRSV